jgi:curved DNA-binding protein CbpA
MKMKDYYAILGVAGESSARQIKRTYKKLAKQLHPDLHPDDPAGRTKMQEINEAYEVLGDQQKRRAYDRRIEEERIIGVQASRFHTDETEHPFLSYFSRMNEILRKRTQK